MKKITVFVFIAFIGISCSTTSSVTSTQNQNKTKLSAVLWQQTSAEYEALCVQTYNLAKKSLIASSNTFLDGSKPSSDLNRPLCIVMDIDETVLDNSPYQASLILNGKPFEESSWSKWVYLESAEAVPGSIEFIQFAMEQNIKVYFISNRLEEYKEATLANLRNLGLEISGEDLYLKQEGLTKTERRNLVDAKGTILLLIGDNLADFDDTFENDLSIEERRSLVRSEFLSEFGERFILIPNVTYGDWGNALKNRKSEVFQDDPNMGVERFLRTY